METRNVVIKYEKTAKWYICGPITGFDMEGRRKAFERAEQLVKEMSGDVEIFNPMRNGLPDDAAYSDHMMCDLEHLVECDAVMVMKGWQNSRGCLIELKFARLLNLAIFGESFAVDGELDKYIRTHPLKRSKS